MSRLLPKDEGFIFINGQEVEAWNSTELAKELAVLKQNQQVHVSMTVEEFVRFGRFPYTKGKITKSDEQIVEESLKNTNIPLLEHKILELYQEASINERLSRWF